LTDDKEEADDKDKLAMKNILLLLVDVSYFSGIWFMETNNISMLQRYQHILLTLFSR